MFFDLQRPWNQTTTTIKTTTTATLLRWETSRYSSPITFLFLCQEKEQENEYSDACGAQPYKNSLFMFTRRPRTMSGMFSSDKRSILAVGDITEAIPDEEADIAVLEEPEHLTWYHHGKRWKTKFRLVVGVVHTNYLEYVRREKNGQLHAFFLKYVNSWVVDIYCHKVICPSAATQDLPRSIICNTHGVNPKFLEIGKKKNEEQQNGNQAFTKGAYYIGKMDLSGVEVDLYGNGEDSAEVQEAANKLELTVRVHPGRDHADPLFHDYKVFLNPSTTDVVCTTSAEALAMGKIV
ncbi:unnamed protein product [Camellia sinensis]